MTGDLIAELQRMSSDATVRATAPIDHSVARAVAPDAAPAGEIPAEAMERARRMRRMPHAGTQDDAAAPRAAEPKSPALRRFPAPASDKPEPAPREDDRPDSKVASQSIRVHVDTLEHLMTMVSELVLTRNQLIEIVRRHEESEFKAPLQRLSNVTAELQDGVLKTRMQPIGNAWQKLPRIVRDLSAELGKPIELEMALADHFAPLSTAPHFCSIARASSCEIADVGGNLSIQANGRQASMIAFECDVTPRALSSDGIRGSSAELQALRTMSICSDGSQRVVTAHITSARFDGSTSSSTTTTRRPM